MANAPSERLIEHALALVVQSEVAPGAAASNAQIKLRSWRGRSAEHDAAANEAIKRWSALGDMAPDLRGHFEESEILPNPARTAPAGLGRRNALLSIAAAFGIGALVGKGVYWHRHQPLFSTAYETKSAQILTVALPDAPGGLDGSRLDLAPQSAVSAKLYRHVRSIEMLRGAVHFDVAHDAALPFEVRTREARIEVIGTAFTIRDRGGPVSVSVERGKVRVHVHPLDDLNGSPVPGPVVDLVAGQGLAIQGSRTETLDHADIENVAAWRQGWLVFENHPLSDALATINAYRTSPVDMADHKVGEMRLTGRFRANDSAGLVAALPVILPLSATTLPDGRVLLRKR